MIKLWKIAVACLAILTAVMFSLACGSNYDLNERAAWREYRQAYGYCKTLTTYDDCMKREGWRP